MDKVIWPLLVWGILGIIALCLSAYNHKKPRPPQNFWTTLIASIIDVLMIVWILGACGKI